MQVSDLYGLKPGMIICELNEELEIDHFILLEYGRELMGPRDYCGVIWRVMYTSDKAIMRKTLAALKASKYHIVSGVPDATHASD